MNLSRAAVSACAIALLAGCGAEPASLSGDAVHAGYAAPPPPGEPTAVDGETYPRSGPRELTVSVPVGGGCAVTGEAAATAVSQTATEVRVAAGVVRPPGPSDRPRAAAAPPGAVEVCPADLILQRVVVTLVDPIGERRVADAVSGLVLRPA